MGLDITAYSNLTPCDAAEAATFDLHNLPDGVMNVRTEPFDGFCRTTGKTREHRFCAGSHSGYNWWRDVLSVRFYGVPAEHVWGHRDDYRDLPFFELIDFSLPFFELIDFSDCEGHIGATVAAKLAADFEAYREEAKGVAVEDREYWLEQYENWACAFALAAQDGVVDFH